MLLPDHSAVGLSRSTPPRSRQCRSSPPELCDHGVAVALGEALALAVGEALPGAAASGNRKVLKSTSLMTKAPSCSSACADHVALSALPPISSLCAFLSSGDVVNVIASCGFSRPCSAAAPPGSHRTACKFDKVVSSDCKFVWLI